MRRDDFLSITNGYGSLAIAVIGDFFLDRYLIVDPKLRETSIETGLEVHNVVAVRSAPGAAGTIAANLSALGVGTIHALGFHGDDGEGFELRQSLARLPGLALDHFLAAAGVRTPTYIKPLMIEDPKPPRELNRLDIKNRSPTPQELRSRICERIELIAESVHAVIVMDQVERPETGVATESVLRAIRASVRTPIILADSRRGLGGFPPFVFKMNAQELAKLSPGPDASLEAIGSRAERLARRNGKLVFVTLSEAGIVCGRPDGGFVHAPAHPVRGPIDIVGAGDAVSANLVAALASGASVEQAMELAMAAASIVIHKLGMTGSASRDEISAMF